MMSEYDFIESQYEEYGEAYINKLMDDGYTPQYVGGVGFGTGWRWVLIPANVKSAVA